MTDKVELTVCAGCEDSMDVSDVTNGADGKDRCDSCHRDSHFSCDGCHDDCHNNDHRDGEDGGDYCDSCFWEHHGECYHCCGTFHNDDLQQSTHYTYESTCRDCAERYEQEEFWDCGSPVRSDDYNDVGSSRGFGVELETSFCDGYTDWAKDGVFGADEDGSISGVEFVSPPCSGNAGLKAIQSFCDRAESNGCEVDDRCGVHLHCDVNDHDADDRKKLALAYYYTQDFWIGCVDEDRNDTFYARKVKGSRHSYSNEYDATSLRNGDDYPYQSTRYFWINWDSYKKYGTVEVRLHHASVNGREVCNWVKAHTRFIDYIKGMSIAQVTRVFGNESPVTIMREMRFIWGDDQLCEFYASRMRKNNIAV